MRQQLGWRRGALAAALTAVAVAPPTVAAGAGPLAPLLAATGTTVPGSYIVVLKGEQGPAVSRAASLGVTVQRRYHKALNGFSAKLTQEQLGALRADPAVAYIQPNQRVGLATVQTPVTWGLDRIDQRQRPLDTIYDYNRTGAGVTVYILDTGIRPTHVEFGGRVSGGYDGIGDGWGTNDCHGHGTHVAGTVGSAAYGVAKAVRLVPVRVIDCDGMGTTDMIAAGVDFVTGHHSGPSVANMSLAISADTVLETAIANSIAAGVTYTVAAGNWATDACASAMARVPAALTVAAGDISDVRPSWSNFGSCVDLFAPGVDVTSTLSASDTAAGQMSGTSMASPHVAGAAALFLQTNPAATPAQVAASIIGNATPGVITDPHGSPNLLLHINGPGTHNGMTWTVKQQRPDNVVHVGSDGATNAYQGDTPATAVLPLLCLLVTGDPIPAGVAPDQYNGWSEGHVALTPPVPGTSLTSQTDADRICAGTFGPGWRMTEFHDGWYWIRLRPGGPGFRSRSGWNLWAHGTLPAGTRFWVSINDQAANPWN